jgi:hypothetical protein
MGLSSFVTANVFVKASQPRLGLCLCELTQHCKMRHLYMLEGEFGS